MPRFAASLRTALLLGTALAAPFAAAADKPPAPTWVFDGSVTAGYRFVDVEGSSAKYREDYNLPEGPVLYGLTLNGLSKAPDRTPLDRFHLEVDTPGNEPVSHFKLTASDRERYDLRINFTRSKYFYAAPQLWEQGVAGDVRLDDLHDFNTTRTNGSVDLTLRSPHLPTLLLGYRLYERNGSGTDTVRIPSGDTFVVNAPVDWVTHVGRIGTEFRALGTDVFLQQEYRRVERTSNQSLPISTGVGGLDPSDLSVLQQWDRHAHEHIDIPATTVRVRRTVGDSVDLTGAYFYSHADLSFLNRLLRDGTSNSPGYSGRATAFDRGSATLDTHVVDLGATWRVSDRVRLHGAYRFNERQQNGALDASSTYAQLAAVTGDHVRVHSVSGDVEVEPRKDLSLRVGARYAQRDAHFASTGRDTATANIGTIADLKYRPCSFVDLYLRYDGAQVDDPITVPGDRSGTPLLPAREIALTFVNRGRTGVRLRPKEWLTLSYELLAESRENGSFHAKAQSFANSVGIALQPLSKLSLYAGYTRRDFDNRADILLAPLYDRTRSLQRGSEDILTSTLDYDFTLLGQSWSTGWSVAWVDAHNTLAPRLEPGMLGLSFFDLSRIDGGAFLTWHHRWIEPSVEFRVVDYGERVLPGNDYRATIVALKLRKTFDFGL